MKQVTDISSVKRKAGPLLEDLEERFDNMTDEYEDVVIFRGNELFRGDALSKAIDNLLCFFTDVADSEKQMQYWRTASELISALGGDA